MSVALRNGCYGSSYSRVAKSRFYQEIGGCYKGTIILKNSVPIRSIPFKCIFVRLEKALMREKKMNAKFHWHYISVRSIVASHGKTILFSIYGDCKKKKNKQIQRIYVPRQEFFFKK